MSLVLAPFELPPCAIFLAAFEMGGIEAPGWLESPGWLDSAEAWAILSFLQGGTGAVRPRFLADMVLRSKAAVKAVP